MPQISAKFEGDELVIRLPYNRKTPESPSGKTYQVATTNGNKEVELEHPDHPGKKVVVGLNAWVSKK
jgi:hypothetical protein